MGTRRISRGNFLGLAGSLGAVAAAGSLVGMPGIAFAAGTERPRVLTDAANVTRIKNLFATHPQLKADWQELVARKAELIAAPLASASWNKAAAIEQERIIAGLSLLYLVGPGAHEDAGRRVVTRVLDQCEHAACASWIPTSWLTMGHSAVAPAIGYDWCHALFTDGQRTRAENGMKARGIDPYMARDFTNLEHNWAGMVNGAMGMLAYSLKSSTAFETVVADCMSKVNNQMKEGTIWRERPAGTVHHNIVSPDGGYPEGGYLDYYARNLFGFFATYRAYRGVEYPLSESMPGLEDMGTFSLHKMGSIDPLSAFRPNRPYQFRFADGSDQWADEGEGSVAMYLARRFNNPLLRWYAQESRAWTKDAKVGGVDGFSDTLRFLNYQAAGGTTVKSPAAAGEPLEKLFRGTAVWTARSSWTDPNALYVGSRVAGDVDEGHQHLDRGSFNLIADGIEYIVDAGEDKREGVTGNEYDDFHSPSLDNPNRWRFPRLRASGHSTKVINPGDYPDQRTGYWYETEKQPVVERSGVIGGVSPFVISDLSNIYKDASVGSLRRGLRLENREMLVVRDEVVGENLDLWTLFQTRKNGGNSAISFLEGNRVAMVNAPGTDSRRLYCRILTEGATFGKREYGALPGVTYLYGGDDINPNSRGFETLYVNQTNTARGSLDLTVALIPVKSGEPNPTSFPAIGALSTW